MSQQFNPNLLNTAEWYEKSILGTLMYDFKPNAKYAEVLEEDCFANPKHKQIFTLIKGIVNDGKPVEFVSVMQYAWNNKTLELCGGQDYIEEIYRIDFDSTNIESHTKELIHAKRLVQLKRLGEKLKTGSADNFADADKITKETEDKLRQIDALKYSDYDLTLGSVVEEILGNMEEQKNPTKPPDDFVTTEFPAFNKVVPEFSKGDLILIAARPSIGKSSFMSQIAEFNAYRNVPVGILSLEMKKRQLVIRIACKRASVDSTMLRGRSQYIPDHHRKRLAEELYSIPNKPLYIEGDIHTLQQVKDASRKLVNEKGCKILFLDYIGIISPEDREKVENTNQWVSKVSKSLKRLAMELDVPFVALSQLNREIEKTDRRPMMSDLRDSGSLEQDADVVMFIHQPEVTGAKKNKSPVEDRRVLQTEIIIAKQRNGNRGIINFMFEPVFTKFIEVDNTHEAPPQKHFGRDAEDDNDDKPF